MTYNYFSGREYSCLTPGIPDEKFYREEVPLTKQEIRVLTLSRLRLEPGARVLDVGAGSGSISVECALLLRQSGGKVYAVEHHERAVEAVRSNLEYFGVNNVQLIHGTAPEVLSDMEPVDRAVIGGTGGKMEEVLGAVYKLLKPGGIIVINCLLLESLYAARSTLDKLGAKNQEVLSAGISRGRELGGGTMLQPLNPAFIVSAGKDPSGQ